MRGCISVTDGTDGGKWVMRQYVGGRYSVETIGMPTTRSTLTATSSCHSRRRRPLSATLRGGPAGCRRASDAGRPLHRPRRIADYLAFVRENRKTARDVRWRVEGLILPELGELACAKLTAEQLRKWHKRLAKQPATGTHSKGQPQRHRTRWGCPGGSRPVAAVDC